MPVRILDGVLFGSAKDVLLRRSDVKTLTLDDGAGGAADFEVQGVIGSSGVFQALGGVQLWGTYVSVLGPEFHGGTAFPDPAVMPGGVFNVQYYRTDLGMWFFYDGTRWLSTQLFSTNLGGTVPAGSLAASTSNMGWAPLGSLHGASDAWLLGVDMFVFVNTGGTALGASHHWDFTVDKGIDGGASFSTIASLPLSSGANGNRPLHANVNALMGAASGFRYSIAKTGTPGAIFTGCRIDYRLVG